jgi:transposase
MPAILPRARAARTRPVPASQAGQSHVEELTDEAIEESFPASDPPALSAVELAERVSNELLEQLLDEALRETFPASDPIAVSASVLIRSRL